MRSVCLLLLLIATGCGPGSGVLDSDDPNLIQGDDVERRDLARIEDMLRGQVAGVRVESVGGILAIRIRGTSTFGNTDPLFVIDGLPLAPSGDGALTGLNPRDVASIRVLKNASDTALYGSRGANGVILITTVRPPQAPPDTAGGNF